MQPQCTMVSTNQVNNSLIRGIKRSQKSPRALVIVQDRLDPSYCLRSASSLHAA
jgi:hypothetical protein